MKLTTKLTDRAKLVLQLIVSGETGCSAVMQAGYAVTSKASASQRATEIKKIPGAEEYMQRLREESHSDAVASIQERKEILTSIARNTSSKAISARISAIHTLNKMDNVYEEKIAVNQTNGIMVVPMAKSLEEWESVAKQSQQILIEKNSIFNKI